MKIKDLSERELVKGIRGRFLHTENNTIAFVDLDKDSILPAHSHIHEQTTEVISGTLELVINGTSEYLEAGEIRYIPSNVSHSAKAITDCKVRDTFYPVREDYK